MRGEDRRCDDRERDEVWDHLREAREQARDAAQVRGRHRGTDRVHQDGNHNAVQDQDPDPVEPWQHHNLSQGIMHLLKRF